MQEEKLAQTDNGSNEHYKSSEDKWNFMFCHWFSDALVC